MTIRETWSRLFHSSLQMEKNLTSQSAKEAFYFIRWTFDKYQEYCTREGYEIPRDLIEEKDQILEALGQKASGLEPRPCTWPIEAILSWEREKPFHEALGARNLNSEWESCYKLARQFYGEIEYSNR
jgi:hypothetical protein